MRRVVLGLELLALALLAQAAQALDVGKEYFLRTTLHAVRGNQIYWVNYTEAGKTELIHAGQKVTITGLAGHVVKFTLAGKEYEFAYTEKGVPPSDDLLAKFFTSDDVAKQIALLPEDLRGKIQRGVADKGMTKEQVLLAVGCPAQVDGRKTLNLSLSEILASDDWVYFHNRWYNRWRVTYKDGVAVSVAD